MINKICLGISYALAFISFVSFLLWAFADSVTFRAVFLISFLLQIYGVLTMGSGKKS